uniref:RxLR effector candidate protein n=1 Tax=Hyaloperonospora arabidopsidis (strain Emoy2) TaxID=559515 RepID=A0A090BFW5_HYAAE|nr:RxLR effector candidate protein [Hyaloperonospora arabidopsidis Emoy2]
MKVPARRSLRSDTATGGGEEERSFRFLDFFSSCFGKSAALPQDG